MSPLDVDVERGGGLGYSVKRLLIIDPLTFFNREKPVQIIYSLCVNLCGKEFRGKRPAFSRN